MALRIIEQRKIGLYGELVDCSTNCETCQFKFLCYTTRGDIILDSEYIKHLHKMKAKKHKIKAKKQGHYYPTGAG